MEVAGNIIHKTCPNTMNSETQTITAQNITVHLKRKFKKKKKDLLTSHHLASILLHKTSCLYFFFSNLQIK